MSLTPDNELRLSRVSESPLKGKPTFYQRLLSRVYGQAPESFEYSTDRIADVEIVVKQAIETLDPRERRVLELRLGFSGESPMTLEKIGKEVGLTRERIRQIEGRAFRLLRHPAKNLRKIVPLPADSIARELFGSELFMDIPQETKIDIRDLPWSPDVELELNRTWPYSYVTLHGILVGSLSDKNLSESARQGIREMAVRIVFGNQADPELDQ